MRDCGECTACCTWLQGSAYGHEFGAGKSCKFLCPDGCNIHKIRPQICENYFCAWSQEVIDKDLRPDQCGIIASVENDGAKQYLRIISIHDEIRKNTIEYFKNWSEIMNTPVIYSNNHQQEIL